MAGKETPIGMFHIDARHMDHTSSLYKTQGDEEQYPMDNAMRFHIEDNVSYWIHARDLPGKPASHGCIGLYDEEMQNRVFGYPAKRCFWIHKSFMNGPLARMNTDMMTEAWMKLGGGLLLKFAVLCTG